MRLRLLLHMASMTLISSLLSLSSPFMFKNPRDNLPQSLQLRLRIFLSCSSSNMSGYLFIICSVISSFEEPYIVDQSMISSATASLSLLRQPKMSVKNLWLAMLLFNLSSIPVIMLSLVAFSFFTRNDSIFFFDIFFPL